ncbi:MAG TPA: carbonic anhydrase [Acidobacteriota bacterium]|nr:carbonic anhydrase [Acidobacteriota bacterium]
MGVIDETLRANKDYAGRFSLGGLSILPARKLAVVACMDARLMVDQALGLKAGDAHIIRNAGGIVTEDVLRSLILSHHLLGIEEVMVVNHTDCGMLTFQDEELRDRLREATGADSETPERFHAFSDLQENVRRQIQQVKSHPWIPNRIPVRGFVYEVQTGRLREVFD